MLVPIQIQAMMEKVGARLVEKMPGEDGLEASNLCSIVTV